MYMFKCVVDTYFPSVLKFETVKCTRELQRQNRSRSHRYFCHPQLTMVVSPTAHVPTTVQLPP